MATYLVLRSVTHDGQEYAPGTTLPLENDQQAAALLSVGAIQLQDEATADAARKEKKST